MEWVKLSILWRYGMETLHDDVIKWKHFPRYWPFVRGIYLSPMNSPHKGQWRGALMSSLICARINGWVNNNEAGDLRRHRTHYDVILMFRIIGALSGRRWSHKETVTWGFDVFFINSMNKLWTNSWVAGNTRCHWCSYDVTVMSWRPHWMAHVIWNECKQYRFDSQ